MNQKSINKTDRWTPLVLWTQTFFYFYYLPHSLITWLKNKIKLKHGHTKAFIHFCIPKVNTPYN